jgi:Short-chain alcohol dehydrogenase of unknown specificity
MTVQNKVIVITGASSGIGEASAKLLAQHGAKVVLGARRESRLQAIVRIFQAAGGQASYRVTDVTKPADVQALVDRPKATLEDWTSSSTTPASCRVRPSVRCTWMSGMR